MTRAAAPRHIASRDNPDYRLWLRLAQGRAARAESRVLLEGEHLCRAWVERYGAAPLAILDERAAGTADGRWLMGVAERHVTLEAALAQALSPLAHGPPGLFLLVEPPRPQPPARMAESCLWLDRVQDPGNLGALLRTAAAAGLRVAHLSPGCAAAWSAKALRGGQGAHFSLQIHEGVDLHAALDRLDIPLAVATLDSARDLYALDLRAPCAWVFGNEGAGVDPALAGAATLRVRIPQADAVESLNVAAAAAVCLFEQRRQRLSLARRPA
ncbi:RNA methyltransferase [Castellaniella sp. GW247-6E4]|uniref:TrmH family RNA methyltransferase n=1 Tax=Castellaniella sp. GW247-6E4 TaxID=3140380 RepID=UPI00331473EA